MKPDCTPVGVAAMQATLNKVETDDTDVAHGLGSEQADFIVAWGELDDVPMAVRSLEAAIDEMIAGLP